MDQRAAAFRAKEVSSYLHNNKFTTNLQHFLPGDIVWLQSQEEKKHKFSLNAGPFRVLAILGNNIFEIQNVHSKEVKRAAINHLRLCIPSSTQI